MAEARTAHVTDFKKLLTLITTMNERDKAYLRYNTDPSTVVDRLLSNILDGHVVLFVEEDEIFGFVEYAIQNTSRIWVYSLYYKEAYRHRTVETLPKFFVELKQTYHLPVHYTIEATNKPAKAIARFIHARPVKQYADGRTEYRVEVL